MGLNSIINESLWTGEHVKTAIKHHVFIVIYVHYSWAPIISGIFCLLLHLFCQMKVILRKKHQISPHVFEHSIRCFHWPLIVWKAVEKFKFKVCGQIFRAAPIWSIFGNIGPFLRQSMMKNGFCTFLLMWTFNYESL